VLIQTEVGRSAQVSAQVTRLEGVISALDVTGPYDVIVLAARPKEEAAESDQS
jgi:DNA-binding Lrp family transcriptional regulator